MIDFSKVKGMTIPEGVVKQITDASGRVLWRATISFTMNGETYEADRGMTWAEWFASDYNTTGETEGDIKDADGNAVSLDAVIVGGAAYEVGFDDGMRKITVVRYGSFTGYGSVTINGTTYGQIYVDSTEEFILPVGTSIACYVRTYSVSAATENGLTAKVIVNGNIVAQTNDNTTYNYIVTNDAIIDIKNVSEDGTLGKTHGVITITEN